MNEESNIERFVKDPSLLVALCTEVIDGLDLSSDEADIGEREAQLREISSTIDRLKKAGVSVPDVLRAEKTRLAASLAIHAEATQALAQLADEFQNIVTDLRERLGQSQVPTHLKPKKKRSRAPKTDNRELRKHIIQALKALGGSARVGDVIEQMGRQLEGKLLPGDMEWRESARECVWGNNAKWERFQMTQDGLLRSGSPRGIWELSEDKE
jgi:hypothetical protein